MEQVEENDTILVRLRKLASQKPDKTAFIFVDKDLNERAITRQQIWERTQKCAAIFKRLGLGKGDVICNTLVNSPERLISYFGSLATGAIPSQGQLFLADGSDLIHNLKESRSSAIVYDPRDTNGAGQILKKIKYVDEATGATCYKDLPNLKIEIEIEAKGLEEGQRWMNVVDKEKEMFVEEDISNDDIAMVFVTSGTTGFSKLVPHPHSTLTNVIRGFEDIGGFSEDGSIFNMQSLGWLGGFPGYYSSFGCVRILTDLTNGPAEKMGEFLISILNQHGPRTGFLIARDNQSVLDAINAGHQLRKQLNILFTGGGPVNNATMEALGKITRKVLAVYGGTEFLIVSAKEVNTKSDFKDMCAGSPRNCEVRIVGEDEKELPSGEQGEILMRSGSVFKGYLNNPTKTAASFTEDGWYKTGDIGYFDKEGDLFVLCRKADAINKDGFIHYPGWMEQLINKHPALEKVAVIGIPDTVHHEEICLCYKTVTGSEVTADDLREYCKTLFLTRENDKMSPVPKHYLAFDDFIVNANGKLDRKKMREEILKLLDQ